MNSVAFSSDGQTLASGSDGKPVRLWELMLPSAAPTVLRETDAVSSLAFSPDTGSLASGSQSDHWKAHDVKLWNPRQPDTKPIILTIPTSAGIYSVAFRSDGQILATSATSMDEGIGGVQLWNLNQPGTKPTVLSEARGYSLAFSPEGDILASAGYRQIQIWILRQLENKPLILEGHEKYVISVAFGPDGHSLASGVGEGIPYERNCPNFIADSESTINPEPLAATVRELVAPVQTSPADKSTFRHYPRTVILRWSNVPGAKSYSVETSFLSGTAWSAATQASNLRSSSYTYDFVGNQTGRWRVWALDSAGRESPMSCWWEFTFTR